MGSNNRNVTKTSHFWPFWHQNGRSTYKNTFLRPNLNLPYSKGGNVYFSLFMVSSLHIFGAVTFFITSLVLFGSVEYSSLVKKWNSRLACTKLKKPLNLHSGKIGPILHTPSLGTQHKNSWPIKKGRRERRKKRDAFYVPSANIINNAQWSP